MMINVLHKMYTRTRITPTMVILGITTLFTILMVVFD